jgi:hypothetical protein
VRARAHPRRSVGRGQARRLVRGAVDCARSIGGGVRNSKVGNMSQRRSVYPLPRILLTDCFLHGFPLRVGCPSAFNASHFFWSDRRPPYGCFLLSSRIFASASASFVMLPKGFRPSHRSPRDRLRSPAARSFVTVTRRSNTATAHEQSGFKAGQRRQRRRESGLEREQEAPRQPRVRAASKLTGPGCSS